MRQNKIRISVTLTRELVKAIDQAIERGWAQNRTVLVENALRNELAARHEAEIDADISKMAQDTDYLAESAQIEAEFALASWEALRPVLELEGTALT